MASNTPESLTDTPPVPQFGERANLSKEEQQALKFLGLTTRIAARRNARPYLAGGALGPALLYALYVLRGGPIVLPVGLAVALELLAALAGSVLVGGIVEVASMIGKVAGTISKVASTIGNSPTLRHYAKAVESWFKYWQGRIPLEHYYEHSAVLDYQRLYGHLPLDARPKTQAVFVREVVRRRMDPKQGQYMGKKAMPAAAPPSAGPPVPDQKPPDL